MAVANHKRAEEAADSIAPFALEICGSVAKMVYFSRHEHHGEKFVEESYGVTNGITSIYHPMLDNLYFIKFETSKMRDCLEFILLHRCANGNATVKATGVDAYKFTDLFKETLGVDIKKENEIDCQAAGANFLLKAVANEAFTYKDGKKEFVQIDHDDLYPFLLVTIGSGVNMIKVDGEGKFLCVGGSNSGAGSFFDYGRLLTDCKSFGELVELSLRGDKGTANMFVRHTYGGMDSTELGLSASMTASNLDEVIFQSKDIKDHKPEDISLALLLRTACDIALDCCLVARTHRVRRIFFGGYFLRDNLDTMDTISSRIQYWSKGVTQAMFLRHERFLGALGAFLSNGERWLDSFMVHRLPETLLQNEGETQILMD